MKEFTSQTGGRYTYIDDIINLQELALAINNIFADCDNFVVSGCSVSGSTIASGYVYLNGKIRRFDGATNVKFPCYIYENDTNESLKYADGNTKVGRVNYGCAASSTLPSNKQYISVTSTGAVGIKEAFFGKYALLLSSNGASSQIGNEVTFTNNVTFSSPIILDDAVKFGSATSNNSISYSNNVLTVQSQTDDKIYKMEISDNGFIFGVNSNTIMQVEGESVVVSMPAQFGTATIGDITISSDCIINNSSALDTGTININLGETTSAYYRNTVIGNGKGTALLNVVGKTGAITANGELVAAKTGKNGLTVKNGSYTCANAALLASIAWKDRNDQVFGTIGYITDSDKAFIVQNTVGDLRFQANGIADFACDIKENGELLSTKYTTSTTFEAEKEAVDAHFTKLEKEMFTLVDWTTLGNTGVKVKQMGSVVNIVGVITSGLADGLTLPETIAAPTETIAWVAPASGTISLGTSSNGIIAGNQVIGSGLVASGIQWKIEAGSRTLEILYNPYVTYEAIYINVTYMV
jgi:hypothetical protein